MLQVKKAILGEQWVAFWYAILWAVGVLARIAPLTDPHARLLRQFMTEDGYIMQTVARNLAINLGMTVSDGTIQTNGVQPLTTFIFSIFYLVAGGDKVGGIAGVQLFSVVVSVAAAYVLYRLVKTILKDLPDGGRLAAMVASLWFASPLMVNHSMNGLETGLYMLVSISTFLMFAKFVERSPSQFTLNHMLCLGVMFGICFLVRNDAVLLIAAILIARFVLLWPQDSKSWRWRIWEGAVPGFLSLLVGLPWLIYNYRLFGSIVPISGIAESAGARFGENFRHVPATVLEYLAVIAAIPRALESNVITVSLSFLLTAAAAFLAPRIIWTQSKSAPSVLTAYTIFAVLVIAFYGLYFGAPHFIPRFLSILSPFFALLGVISAYRLLLLMNDRLRSVLLKAGAALATVAVIVVNGTFYRDGLKHQHMQVVDWVNANVPPDTWVGAIQTGTLGFFHDRTINLDGKVNPDALRAAIEEGGVTSYVLRSKIVYLVDWYGIATWMQVDKDDFNRKFELFVIDERANLAVLRRVGS